MFYKKYVLKNFTKFIGKRLRPAVLLKEAVTLVLSGKFCEFFENNYFIKHSHSIFLGRFSLQFVQKILVPPFCPTPSSFGSFVFPPFY